MKDQTMSDTATNTRAPLEGLKVLDLTIAMAGPLCTQRMGEMGAEIIKIEAPGGGDFSRHAPMAGITKFGDATCFVTLNQNKKSLVLDLKSDAGREVLYRLVEQADVLIQNFRPRVAKKLGIEYQTLREINPRLVYGSVSGYGEDGPMKDRPGQDLLLQSFTGLTMNGGKAGELPQASPLYMVDVSASHMVCEGVLAALVARSITGVGQEVKVTMLSAIMEMQCQEIMSYITADAPPKRGTSPQVSIYQEPPYGIYKCSEGFLSIAQADLDVLAEVLKLPKLSDMKLARPEQSNGDAVAEWRDGIYAELAALFLTNTATHWDAILAPLGVWCVVVNDYDSFLNHPQTQDKLIEVEHPVGGKYTAVAPAISFSDNPKPSVKHAPQYGADTVDILASFGFSGDEISTLAENKTVIAG
ncbi:CaiB/BaiF CoA-transferase family protein [Halocynthiibacter sp. C4]|uniref:CaiB/BaiF CoA transferase family protein n=1 Tax=Halocynthiibacter sp. C4 TaxID=2992758 RepID=UPI00237A1FB4|nr:CaiB/BaiF CoA-transferase family protein [Halocynthiibacter sp. C4]MDE0591439.1 CaiB/BaiF CoA-transferase family protein [Halocynthiibacter sp. C4]